MRTSMRRPICQADTAAPSWPSAIALCPSRAMPLSTLSVSLLLEVALQAFEDNLLGPRVYEASFKAALNVFQTNAVPFVAPCLPACSRALKTNPYACLGVAIMASSSGPQDAAEGAYHSCLYRQHNVQICLSGDRRMFGFPFEYGVSEITRGADFEQFRSEADTSVGYPEP
jgi:hypothetical protein